jgi:DNA-binding GntR family transcriptional regulator
MRKMLEPELAARATSFVSDAVIAQMHQIDSHLNATIEKGDVQGYMQQNYLFHKALYDCADAPVISDTVDRLWLRFGPSQREMFGRVGTANLPDRHVEVLQALKARDPKAAAQAMAEDVAQGQFLHLGQSSAIDAT